MDNSNLKTLELITNAYHNREPISGIWSEMHRLAEDKYEPAMDLFKAFLNDENWAWREEGVNLLGFHYDFDQESEIINKFRQLLDSDPEPGVRISAASALASRTTWPEESLFVALKNDENSNVKRAIFGALQLQAGLPPYRIIEEEKRIDEGEITPSLSEIRRIFKRESIDLEIPE